MNEVSLQTHCSVRFSSFLSSVFYQEWKKKEKEEKREEEKEEREKKEEKRTLQLAYRELPKTSSPHPSMQRQPTQKPQYTEAPNSARKKRARNQTDKTKKEQEGGRRPI